MSPECDQAIQMMCWTVTLYLWARVWFGVR